MYTKYTKHVKGSVPLKQKAKWLKGLLLVVFVVLSTISVSAVSLDLDKTGAKKTDLIPLGIETATVNGQKFKVGERVAVTYYVSSDAKWEDFQGYATYDPTGLRFEKFILPNTTSNVFINTDDEVFLYYAGSSFTDYFDFTTEKALYIAEFTVLSGGDYTVENTWEVIDDENCVSIVDGDFYDEGRLSCRFETTVVQYTVTFKNYDETVISTKQYDAGATVVVPTETPVRPADQQYTYTFSGWDKDVVEIVNADATYTAVFTGTLNKYSVSVSGTNGTVTGCPTEDVDYGTSVTLKAKAKEGYKFDGYYVGDTRVSNSSTYTFTVNDNTDVVAKFTQMPFSELNVSVSSGTKLKVKLGINGVETTQPATYKNQNVRTGQYVTLTPIGIGGYDFLYWKSDNGKIVSYSQSYTFMFTGKTSLTAVFSQNSDGVVTFMSGYNQNNSSMCYGSEDEITLPTPYSKSGYTFKFWSIDGKTECTVSDIYTASRSGNVTVKAVYEADEVYYSLTINGGAIVSVDNNKADAGNTTGLYKTINAIKVQANEAETGKKFAYWTNQDGKVLSYSTACYMYLNKDTTITAVYVDESETVEKKAIADISSISYDEENNLMNVTATIDVPDDCIIVSGGLLATNDLTVGSSTNSFTYENAQYKKVLNKESSNLIHYEYTWTKSKVSYGDIWFLRAYVTYKDANGNIYEVYGDVVTN